MTQLTDLNSYAARGLNMEQALRTTQEDRFPMRAGKFAAGTALTVTTVALAAAEAILSAAATLATLPVSYFVPERYAAIKTHTADSARTMALAAKRTFGAEIISANQKAAPQVASSRVSQLQELVKAKATTALQFGKENKTALIASAIAVTVVSAYYFGLFDYAASLVQAAPKAQTAAKKAAERMPLRTPSMPTPPASNHSTPTAPLPSWIPRPDQEIMNPTKLDNFYSAVETPSPLSARTVTNSTNNESSYVVGAIITSVSTVFFAAWPVAALLV